MFEQFKLVVLIGYVFYCISGLECEVLSIANCEFWHNLIAIERKEKIEHAHEISNGLQFRIVRNTIKLVQCYSHSIPDIRYTMISYQLMFYL